MWELREGLLCVTYQTLNDYTRGKQLILFPENLCFQRRSWKFTKPSCNGGRWSTFAGNSALLHSDFIDFAMLPAQRILAGNTFMVGCHVTSKLPMRARAVGKKKNAECLHSTLTSLQSIPNPSHCTVAWCYLS